MNNLTKISKRKKKTGQFARIHVNALFREWKLRVKLYAIMSSLESPFFLNRHDWPSEIQKFVNCIVQIICRYSNREKPYTFQIR